MRLRGPHPWEGAFWSDARSGFRYGWIWGWMFGTTAGLAIIIVGVALGRSLCEP